MNKAGLVQTVILNSAGHLVLMPVKLLIVAGIKAFGWRPGFDPDVQLSPTEESIESKFRRYTEDVLVSSMKAAKDTDGAKVLSLLEYADYQYPRSPFFRYLKDEGSSGFTRGNSDIAFSRDMDAGLLMIAWKYFKDDDGTYLGVVLRSNLSRAVDYTALTKPYMKHKGTGNRGYKFKWWFMGDHWLDTLTWLGVYSKIFPDKKYLKWLYRLVMVISFPLPWVTPETSVFVGRFMALGWYNAHSRALNAYLMYQVTGNHLYLIALKNIEKKFWFNPEIQAMYQLCLPAKERSPKALAYIEDWLKDYTEDYEVIPDKWNKWYFNLENFINDGTIKTWYADRVLSSKYRRTSYNWSKKMIKNEDHKELATRIDYIVLYHWWQLLKGGD